MFVKIIHRGRGNNPSKEVTWCCVHYSLEHLQGKKILSVFPEGNNQELNFELFSDDNYFVELFIMNSNGKTIDHFDC